MCFLCYDASSSPPLSPRSSRLCLFPCNLVMDGVQCPLFPKEAITTNNVNIMLGCFLQSSSHSEFPHPRYLSSQAVLCDNGILGADMIHPWRPMTAPIHPHTDPPSRAPTFTLVAEAGCSEPVVSAPFSPRLDMVAVESRDTPLPSLSPKYGHAVDKIARHGYAGKIRDRVIHRSEESVTATSKVSMDLSNVARREHGMVVQTKKGPPKQREGDLPVSLKLGKRAYFREADGGDKGNKQSLTGNCSNSKYGSAFTNNVMKKHKASPPPSTPNVPRCQAEDCRIDLSYAKDYHRRHKVCEWHAKSSKAKVANLDQRFCQQCSRFHVLSEFDEGKRSCRRRLAGHNERRRKQQPEPFSFLSAANYAYFTGAKRLFGASLLDGICLSNHEHHAAELKTYQKPREELMKAIQGSELHEFMQKSKRGDEHVLVGGNAQAFVLSGGSGIDLTTTPAPLTTLMASFLTPTHLPQPLPETLVSGRALSLLSSLGLPNTTNPMSTTTHGAPSSPSSLERQVVATQHAVPGLTSFLEKAMEAQAHSHSHEGVSGLSVGYGPTEVVPSPVLNYGGSSMFSIMLEGGDVQSCAARPVLDLMQTRPGQQRHGVEHHHFMDMEGFSIFGRQGLM